MSIERRRATTTTSATSSTTARTTIPRDGPRRGRAGSRGRARGGPDRARRAGPHPRRPAPARRRVDQRPGAGPGCVLARRRRAPEPTARRSSRPARGAATRSSSSGRRPCRTWSSRPATRSGPAASHPNPRSRRFANASRSLRSLEASVLGNRELFGRLATTAMLPHMERTFADWSPDVVLRDPCEYASAVVAGRLGIPTAQIAISVAEGEAASIGVAAPALEEHRAGLVEELWASPYLTRFPVHSTRHRSRRRSGSGSPRPSSRHRCPTGGTDPGHRSSTSRSGRCWAT